MTPTERRRPATRRRRLAHLGVGGILAAVASSQADVPASRAELPSPVGDVVVAVAPAHLRPDIAEVSRSLPRRGLGRNERRKPSASGWDAAQAWAEESWAIRVRRCESSDNPRSATNPPYEGLYQMDADFWASYGGLAFARSPIGATRAEQNVVAYRGWEARGAEPWPVCGR